MAGKNNEKEGGVHVLWCVCICCVLAGKKHMRMRMQEGMRCVTSPHDFAP